MPLVELDRFLLLKGHGIYNIHEFIDAMLGSNSVEEGYASLNDNHHDLNHNSFSGVEADAVKLAVELHLGNLTQQDVDIINAGEGANPQAWYQAFQKAVNAGAPMINEAIQKTNEYNRKASSLTGETLREIPLAFQQDMGNWISVQAWRTPVLGYKGEGTFNSQGALVTQYVSKLTGKPETYARPYFIGLQQMRAEAHPNGKVPKASDEINPNILHGDSLFIKDNNLRSKFALAVQGIKNQNPNAHPEELKQMALETLRTNPAFSKFAGIRHSGGLTLGKYSPQAITEMAARQDMEQINTEQDSYQNLLNFVHPELRNHAAFRTTGNSYYHNENVSNKMLKLYQQHHGWDEDTTRAVYQDAYSGNYSGNSRDKLLQAIRNQEMKDGKPPTWAENAVIPSGYGIPSPVDEQTMPQQNQDIVTPPEEARQVQPTTPIEQIAQLPPPPPILPTPEAPPQNAHVVGASPTPQNPPPTPPPTLNAYPSKPTPVQNTGRGFLDNLMYRLGYAYESLFPSFGKSEEMTDKEMIKSMLENIQLELAKSECVESSLTKNSKSIHSLNDVSLVAKKMNRPNNDIISIFHSRGDWREIAKSFDMTHEEVQLVKVVFNE